MPLKKTKFSKNKRSKNRYSRSKKKYRRKSKRKVGGTQLLVVSGTGECNNTDDCKGPIGHIWGRCIQNKCYYLNDGDKCEGTYDSNACQPGYCCTKVGNIEYKCKKSGRADCQHVDPNQCSGKPEILCKRLAPKGEKTQGGEVHDNWGIVSGSTGCKWNGTKCILAHMNDPGLNFNEYKALLTALENNTSYNKEKKDANWPFVKIKPS